MTHTQLEALKKMSVREITKKYFPILNAGTINREQYDWLLSQASSTSPEATERTETNETQKSEETISQFTTHNDEVAGRTQKQKLLEVLKDGAWHPTTEILGRVYGLDHSGIARIGARIHDLKEDGHRIESEKLKDSVWQYRLVEQSVLVPDGQTNS